MLDLHPNLDFHKIYRSQRKKIEKKYPELIATKTGKCKTLSRDWLGVAIRDTVKIRHAIEERLKLYQKWGHKLGYNVSIDDDEDGGDNLHASYN